MNKEETIALLAQETGFTRKEAAMALEAMLQIITGALSSGDKVQFSGFGAFEVKNRAPRSGRNPKSNQPVAIPARKSPVFKPGKALKEAVNVL